MNSKTFTWSQKSLFQFLTSQFNFLFRLVDHSFLKYESSLSNTNEHHSLAYRSLLVEQKFEFFHNLSSFFLAPVCHFNNLFRRVVDSFLKHKSILLNPNEHHFPAYRDLLVEQKSEFLLHPLSVLLSLVREQHQPRVCTEVEHLK